ncbi:Hypothetical predicted protein [Octopus vulgaris]|uniref:Uncharacterized protein n=1 Tax=Octopus vulgaris TaxID=6645 RepID=A0AA36AFQ4_OCTVU|nr:Hypothetical predicted protein [Octopus vulgaris]
MVRFPFSCFFNNDIGGGVGNCGFAVATGGGGGCDSVLASVFLVDTAADADFYNLAALFCGQLAILFSGRRIQ